MALFLDIVCPTSEVIFGMERRGMPLDETRRAALVARFEARRDALKTKVAESAAEFHARRVGKIEVGIGKIQDQIQAFDEKHPACSYHPAYRGFGKLGKRLCEECRTMFHMRTPERQARAALKKRLDKARQLRSRVGEEFDAESPDSWRAWLFSVEGLGLRSLETTPTGKPKIDDDVLEALAKKHPECKPLGWRVDLSHTLNKLNGPLAVKADERGRVRYAYSLHRTANGQIASGLDGHEDDKERDSEGNAQNITEVLRQMYRAEPGFRVVHIDYAQIESRIMAWLARARGMTEAFLRGEDIHALNAAAIYGCAPDQARKHMVRFGGTMVSARYACKRATHGWDYGMGDIKTSRIYGLTIAEARRARAAYFRAWPELAYFQEMIVGKVNREKMLTNVFGRRLRFWSFAYRGGRWETADREEAIAFPVASAAKDMTKLVMAALDEAARLAGGEFWTQTHDSFTFQIPEPNVEEFVNVTRPILEAPRPEFGEWVELGEDKADFWCPAEYAVGSNWGEAHRCGMEYKDGRWVEAKPCPADCDRENLDGLVKLVLPPLMRL